LTKDKNNWTKSELPARYLMLDGKFTDDLNVLFVGGGGTILFTEDGGASWNQATASDNGKTKLNSVNFIDKRTGWIAGQEGKIYFTSNGGKNWLKQNSGTSENLFGIFFINTEEGLAVGDNGTILRTKDGGKVWILEPTDTKHKLEKVYMVGEMGFAVGFGGTILAYNESALSK
jgi:photosystem II stability/assembly factor-like uncharacterized protein